MPIYKLQDSDGKEPVFEAGEPCELLLGIMRMRATGEDPPAELCLEKFTCKTFALKQGCPEGGG